MDEAKIKWVRAWLRKAASDLHTAIDLAKPDTEHPDTGMYHCQQAAEKAVKAYLAFVDAPIKKTHEVSELVELALALEPSFQSILDVADIVTPLATRFRYPAISDFDLEPTNAEFEEALAARRIYDFVLSVLPPETHPV